MDQCINGNYYYYYPVNIGRQEKLVEQIKAMFFPAWVRTQTMIIHHVCIPYWSTMSMINEEAGIKH